MAILSTTEVKTYLGIISTDYDDRIAAFLPIAIQDFFDYTNNYFDNNAVRINTSGVAASSTALSLTLSNTNFSTYGFVSGDEIRVRNSRRNDGFYTAATVSSATMTMASSSVSVATYTLKDELAYEAEWIINKIDVPMAVKPIIASMIWAKIDRPTGAPQSESLGDYSVTYGTGAAGYPDSISQAMNKYRVVRFA